MIQPIVIAALSGMRERVQGSLRSENTMPVSSIPTIQGKYNPESDLALLRTHPYLWDLRHWRKEKDPDEVIAWIEQIAIWDNDTPRNGGADAKGNCNNLRYNIRFLLKLGKVNKMKIAKAILDNPHVRYRDQIGTLII